MFRFVFYTSLYLPYKGGGGILNPIRTAREEIRRCTIPQTRERGALTLETQFWREREGSSAQRVELSELRVELNTSELQIWRRKEVQ